MDRRTTRPGEQSRVPLERAIGLRFKHFGDFIEVQTVDISTGGMFIRTGSPHPVGSVLEFEVELGHDLPPVAGKAQVAWVRRRSLDADLPVGMGVRFVELADDSRRHIAELVAARPEAGGRSVEIAPPPVTSAAADDDAEVAAAATAREEILPAERAVAAPSPPPAMPTPEEAAARGSRLPWILLAIALAALAAALWRRPAPDAPLGAGPVPVEQPAVGATSSPAADPAVEKPAQVRLVDAWASAWSEQRVDDYLEVYSLRFDPAGGLDRAAWQRQRRARILAPDKIEVGLAFVELEEIDEDRSRVRFVQVYESDSYRDVVRKVLDLEREESGWKILRETVDP